MFGVFFNVSNHFLKICIVFSVCTLMGNPSAPQTGQVWAAASRTASAVSRLIHPAGTPSRGGRENM